MNLVLAKTSARFSRLFFGLWESIAKNDLSQLKAASILHTLVSTAPVATAIYLGLLQYTDAAVAYDPVALRYYYLFSVGLSAYFLVIGLVGFKIPAALEKPFMLLATQSFVIGFFTLCVFLGIFVSPISLTLVIALGIGVLIYEHIYTLLAFFTLAGLIVITAFLQMSGYLKLWPLMVSLEAAEQHNMKAVVATYAIAIPFVCYFFSIAIYAFINEIRRINQQLEQISVKLVKSLSPQVYDSIFSKHKNARVEAHTRFLTIFCTDLAPLKRALDLGGNAKSGYILEDFLKEISALAEEYGGTIDNFTNNKVMIFFGNPYSKDPVIDAVNCVYMGMAINERFQDYVDHCFDDQPENKPALSIGINSGDCTVGDFGTDRKMNYTVVGEQVDLAIHLQKKADKNAILVSAKTRSLINDDIRCKKKDIIANGSLGMVQTWEAAGVYADQNLLDTEMTEELQEFLKLVKFDTLSAHQQETIISMFRMYCH